MKIDFNAVYVVLWVEATPINQRDKQEISQMKLSSYWFTRFITELWWGFRGFDLSSAALWCSVHVMWFLITQTATQNYISSSCVCKCIMTSVSVDLFSPSPLCPPPPLLLLVDAFAPSERTEMKEHEKHNKDMSVCLDKENNGSEDCCRREGIRMTG